jgi:hypothetical protein
MSLKTRVGFLLSSRSSNILDEGLRQNPLAPSAAKRYHRQTRGLDYT